MAYLFILNDRRYDIYDISCPFTTCLVDLPFVNYCSEPNPCLHQVFEPIVHNSDQTRKEEHGSSNLELASYAGIRSATGRPQNPAKAGFVPYVV